MSPSQAVQPMAAPVPFPCEPSQSRCQPRRQAIGGAAGTGHILFGCAGQETEIGAAQWAPGLGKLEARSGQDPANGETKALYLLGEAVGSERFRQKGFDKFEEDPDLR